MLIPLPNAKHKEVDFEEQKVLINGEDVFQLTLKLSKRRILKRVSDACLRNVLKSHNECKMRFNEQSSAHEIDDGIVVVQNWPVERYGRIALKEKLQ